MKKVIVDICTSPACYTHGARLFKELSSVLCACLKSQIELTGSDCPGFCAQSGCTRAPCARINGRLIPEATAGEIIAALREEVAPRRLVA